MKRFNLYCSAILIFAMLFQSSGISAAEVIEVPMKPEDANMQIISILTKVNPDGHVEDYKTEGFIYRYNSTFFSPFSHKIYIGRMSQRSIDSLVRVESREKGQEKMWRQIFEAELLKTPPAEGARQLERKSHFFSQTLNLITPAFSVMYNSYDSPLMDFRDTLWASTFYFIADVVLVGGAILYARGKRPSKSLGDSIINKRGPRAVEQGPDAGGIIGAVALTRLYRILGAAQDTSAHNQLVELEYSFSF
ncbi:MAG: hypothetical protein JJT78_14560 [Leptospira sp.]|nr:hypothetical protein [Leptospira sp.]